MFDMCRSAAFIAHSIAKMLKCVRIDLEDRLELLLRNALADVDVV